MFKAKVESKKAKVENNKVGRLPDGRQEIPAEASGAKVDTISITVRYL